MRKINTYIYVYVVIISLLVITAFYPVFAYVMESNNYRIQSDSLNIGGASQTTDNYIMQDTIGEVATGISTSNNYKLKAGYQQMQEVYLSISDVANFAMSASIPGLTGNPGSPTTGDGTWTVRTDNPAGFNMTIKASTDPALQLPSAPSNYFSDYTPTNSGTPDYDWTSSSSGAAEFGFTVEPETAADTVQLFLDDAGASGICDVSRGSQTTDKCWYKLATSDFTIINRTSATDSGGEDEKVKFQAESNAKLLQDGDYTATITLTVITN